MFKRLQETDGSTVMITIEDQKVTVPSTDSVAAAMLAAGIKYSRTTPQRGEHRAPYCMMGTCFDCLVEINGVPNQQACQTKVQDGMVVKIQKGAVEADISL